MGRIFCLSKRIVFKVNSLETNSYLSLKKKKMPQTKSAHIHRAKIDKQIHLQACYNVNI